MNKKWKIYNFIWILTAAASRVIYFYLRRSSSVIAGFLGLSQKEILDTYGYFEYSMIRTEETKRALAAGLSAGYGENLSWFLRFAGNKTEAVCAYQLVLQIVWLILFFAGMSLLFGRIAGMTAGSILILSPWIINTVFVIRPENYYMLHWTMVLAILGCLQIPVRNKGLNNWSRLCLIVMGFYLGVICIRNSLGVYLPIWLFCAVAGGIACQWVFNVIQKKKAGINGNSDGQDTGKQSVKADKIKDAGSPVKEDEKTDYFITEDGRKIKYIENPLPGPKKHVKRKMDFDLKDFDDLEDFPDENDFDYKIRENDDFDF